MFLLMLMLFQNQYLNNILLCDNHLLTNFLIAVKIIQKRYNINPKRLTILKASSLTKVFICSKNELKKGLNYPIVRQLNVKSFRLFRRILPILKLFGLCSKIVS
jgi:hypothetical protein